MRLKSVEAISTEAGGILPMPTNPTVSVVIPVYNRAGILARALRSCLSQTFDDIEVIVVDDGSNDRPDLVVESFSDSRLRLLRHADNCGGAEARNTGIRHARGRYVAFLDSDDEWLPQKLEKQLSLLNGHPNPGKLVCYSRLLQDRGRSLCRLLPHRPKRDDEPFCDYITRGSGVISTITLLLTRDLALQCLFDPELPRHQDFDFCMRLEAHGANFAFVAEPLAIWRYQGGDNRVSSSARSAPSWVWYDKYKDQLTPTLQLLFLARFIGPASVCRRPGHITSLLVEVLPSHTLTWRELIRLLSYLLVGHAMIRRIVNIILYVRHLAHEMRAGPLRGPVQ